MLTTTISDLTQDAKQALTKQLPSVYKRFEKFVLKLIFIVPVLLAPFLVYEKHHHVSARIQGISSIASIILAILITLWITKKFEGSLSNSKRIDKNKYYKS